MDEVPLHAPRAEQRADRNPHTKSSSFIQSLQVAARSRRAELCPDCLVSAAFARRGREPSAAVSKVGGAEHLVLPVAVEPEWRCRLWPLPRDEASGFTLQA